MPERRQNLAPERYQFRIVAMPRIGTFEVNFGFDSRGPLA